MLVGLLWHRFAGWCDWRVLALVLGLRCLDLGFALGCGNMCFGVWVVVFCGWVFMLVV